MMAEVIKVVDLALESAVPTAPVIIVDAAISQTALIPTKAQQNKSTFCPPISSLIYSVFPNSPTSAVIKNTVFKNAEKKPVTAQDT